MVATDVGDATITVTGTYDTAQSQINFAPFAPSAESLRAAMNPTPIGYDEMHKALIRYIGITRIALAMLVYFYLTSQRFSKYTRSILLLRATWQSVIVHCGSASPNGA
jgi:hypothetical protein